MLSSSWNYSGCPCAKWKHETGQGMLVSTPTSVDVSTTHTDVVGVTPTLSGRHLAQLVEHASHVRLCSKPGFNSRPGSLCCVSFPLSLSLFPVISSAVLTIKPKIYILKKNSHTMVLSIMFVPYWAKTYSKDIRSTSSGAFLMFPIEVQVTSWQGSMFNDRVLPSNLWRWWANRWRLDDENMVIKHRTLWRFHLDIICERRKDEADEKFTR